MEKENQVNTGLISQRLGRSQSAHGLRARPSLGLELNEEATAWVEEVESRGLGGNRMRLTCSSSIIFIATWFFPWLSLRVSCKPEFIILHSFLRFTQIFLVIPHAMLVSITEQFHQILGLLSRHTFSQYAFNLENISSLNYGRRLGWPYSPKGVRVCWSWS